ncbi:MAG: calcium-binding protein [Micromonosporaceae bacterium]
MRRRALRLGVVAAVTAAATMILAQPAHAAWAQAYVSGDVLHFSDAPDGTANVNITARVSGKGILFDAQYVIVPSTGCSWPDADHTRVLCSGAVSLVEMHGGPGNDVMDVDLGGLFASIPDILYGEAGDDTLLGGRGATSLWGGNGNDVMYGRGGGDGFVSHVVAEDGSDQMYGGPGNDTVDYIERTAGVHASLDGVVGDDGAPGEGDTIGADIENIVASAYDDVLIGNNADNRILACGGSNTVDAMGGNDFIEEGDGLHCGLNNPIGPDVIIGGTGVDTASYSRRSSGVTIDLDNVYDDDGAPGEGDSIIDIENLYATEHNDVLTGNSGANTLNGSYGNDTIFGLGGDDTIFGEQGNDALYGGDGADFIDGGNDSDFCSLGLGGLTKVNCEP